MSRREEHIADTRNGILEAARELFATNGYAQTSLDDVARVARVNRLSIYHHFRSKQGLFEAVLEQVDAEFIKRLVVAASPQPGADAWEAITAGCLAFLDEALEPDVQRIVLIEGPAILGWTEWRAVGARHGFGLMHTVIARAMADGLLPTLPVGPLVHLLSGALNEAASYIAHASDRDVARAEMGEALAGIMAALGASGDEPAAVPTVIDLADAPGEAKPARQPVDT